MAGTAFTALVDSLWISLIALLPDGNGIPTANLLLGMLGVTSTAGLRVRLSRARPGERFTHRWPVLLGLILATYVWQVVVSFTAKTQRSAMHAGATFVLVFFAVGIARSRELLGMRGGGFLDLLVGRAQAGGTSEPPESPAS